VITRNNKKTQKKGATARTLHDVAARTKKKRKKKKKKRKKKLSIEMGRGNNCGRSGKEGRKVARHEKGGG
jgi:hypothetical protein